MSKSNVIAVGTAVIILTAGLAAGRLVKRHSTSEINGEEGAIGGRLTPELLERLSPFRLGDTIPQHTFVDLQGRPTVLRDVISSKTLVTILDYGCSACEDQADALGRSLKRHDCTGGAVVVCEGSRGEWAKWQKKYGLDCTLLIDHNREFVSDYGIDAFPFHMVVSQSRTITDLAAGRFTSEQVDGILRCGSRENDEGLTKPD